MTDEDSVAEAVIRLGNGALPEAVGKGNGEVLYYVADVVVARLYYHKAWACWMIAGVGCLAGYGNMFDGPGRPTPAGIDASLREITTAALSRSGGG